MITSLPLGSNPQNLPQAAFIALITESKVWKDYDEISNKAKKTIVPQVLMVQRWDGFKGFVGGKVEEGESIKVAVSRECIEEINFRMTKEELKKAKLIASHSTGNLVTHLIVLHISPERMREAVIGSHDAKHNGSEIVSVIPVPFINYKHMPSFDNFMKNNFSSTVKEEIVELVKKLGWQEKYNLQNIDFHLNKPIF